MIGAPQGIEVVIDARVGARGRSCQITIWRRRAGDTRHRWRSEGAGATVQIAARAAVDGVPVRARKAAERAIAAIGVSL